MAKRKVSRLIAAILTMVMAFTVLAVPASAATWGIEVKNVPLGEDGETVTIVITNQAVPLLIQTLKDQAGGELDQIDGLLDVAGKLASGSLGKLVFSLSSTLLDQVNKQLDGDTKIELYDGDVPKNAYIGIIGTGSSTPNWYSETAAKQVINAVTSGDDTTVEITADGLLRLNGEDVAPIPESELKYPNKVLLYAGAAVAVAGAATAVYFYTHPAAWEKVTTTVKNTWNKITGKPTESAPAEIVEEGEETPVESADTPVETDAAAAGETPEEAAQVVVAMEAA